MKGFLATLLLLLLLPSVFIGLEGRAKVASINWDGSSELLLLERKHYTEADVKTAMIETIKRKAAEAGALGKAKDHHEIAEEIVEELSKLEDFLEVNSGDFEINTWCGVMNDAELEALPGKVLKEGRAAGCKKCWNLSQEQKKAYIGTDLIAIAKGKIIRGALEEIDKRLETKVIEKTWKKLPDSVRTAIKLYIYIDFEIRDVKKCSAILLVDKAQKKVKIANKETLAELAEALKDLANSLKFFAAVPDLDLIKENDAASFFGENKNRDEEKLYFGASILYKGKFASVVVIPEGFEIDY